MQRLFGVGPRAMLARLPAVAVLIVSAAVLAPPAAATAPVRSGGTFTQTVSLEGVCPFTISVESTITYREMDFYDQNGTQTGALIHVDEQDVFTANGKTLTGLPFTFELQFVLEDGVFTHVFSDGVVERVPLPDGSLFLSAGRLDFFDHPGAAFLLSPDVGNPGNIAGFCAALSA
jgi:hypothetical protein